MKIERASVVDRKMNEGYEKMGRWEDGKKEERRTDEFFYIQW